MGAAKGSIVVSYSDIVSVFTEKPSSPSGMKLVGTNLAWDDRTWNLYVQEMEKNFGILGRAKTTF